MPACSQCWQLHSCQNYLQSQTMHWDYLTTLHVPLSATSLNWQCSGNSLCRGLSQKFFRKVRSFDLISRHRPKSNHNINYYLEKVKRGFALIFFIIKFRLCCCNLMWTDIHSICLFRQKVPREKSDYFVRLN